MPRLNVEDRLFTDARFISLCVLLRSDVKALGWWVKVAFIAQSYWKNNKELIPFAVYKFGKFPKELIESGLIERRENGYYLVGSEEHFAWIFSKVENGKLGGKARASSYNKKKFVKRSDSDDEATSKPLPLSHSLPLLPAATPTNVVLKNAVRDFMIWWNKAAEQVDIIKIHESPDNIALISRHIAENPDMEYWKMAINAISLDSFYQGKNRSKSKMNIVWFFKNRTVANLLDVHETKKDLFKGVLDD